MEKKAWFREALRRLDRKVSVWIMYRFRMEKVEGMQGKVTSSHSVMFGRGSRIGIAVSYQITSPVMSSL